MSRKHCLKVAEDSATKDNVDNPHIIGHAAHDIVDDDGRLMLAEGTAVTATMYYKLTKRGIKLVIINSPTGPKILQPAFYKKQLLFRNPIKLPERLDPKFDKLDLTCVGNAVTCVRAILDKVSQDIFYGITSLRWHTVSAKYTAIPSMFACWLILLRKKLTYLLPTGTTLAWQPCFTILASYYCRPTSYVLPMPMTKPSCIIGNIRDLGRTF